MLTIISLGGYSLSFISGYLWLIALFFVISLSASWFYYRRTNPPLPSSKRIILGLLRGIALTTLLFIIAEPLLTITKQEIKKPIVAILVDNSTSMKANRHSAESFSKINDLLEEITTKVDRNNQVITYTFSDTVIQDGIIDGNANTTAIGNAFHTLKESLATENLQSVILLSDGASNLGVNPAGEARKLDVPVHTIGFGSPDPLPDISITDINHNQVGFEGKEFPIEVKIQSRGFDKLRLPIIIKERGKTLVQRNIELTGEGREQKLKLSFIPSAEGVHTLEISIPTQPDEQSDRNNSRQIKIKIRKSKIKILLAMNYLNWEFKFLKKAIENKEDFELSYSIKSPQKLSGSIPFPENLNNLAEFDAVILYDFESEWFAIHKQLLDSFFERTGKGIFIMAGERLGTSISTQYLENLLPYKLVSGKRGVIDRETNFQLTAKGRIHPVLKQSDDINKSEDLLSALPPFSAFIDARPKEGKSVILANAEFLDNPIIGLQRYKNGKVALLSAFPFWRLNFLTKSFAPEDSTYSRLIENMILWLVERDDLEKMRISPEKPIFVSGETVILTANVLDDAFQPIDDAEVEAELISNNENGDTLTVHFVLGRPGRYQAEIHHLPSGSYNIKGRITRNDVMLGKPKSEVVVEPYSLEDLVQVSDFDMLKRISKVSGGSFVAATDLASFENLPQYNDKNIIKHFELALFDYPAMLILFLLTVCAEWFIRRSYQLL